MSDSKTDSGIYLTVAVADYHELVQCLEEIKEDGKTTWIFRAQPSCGDLETTLERTCKSAGFKLGDSTVGIETEVVRHFRRIYDGDDRQEIENDTLYCFSLMRHYGAPTRLLDFTYSKYVATYFALECAYDDVLTNKDKGCCAVWCIQADELTERVKDCYRDTGVPGLIEKRRENKTRNDDSFRPLYMEKDYKLVGWENPVRLHKRLHLQQGVFLCPGNVRVSFMENLVFPYGNKKTDKIKKINCTLKPEDLRKGFEELMRRNLTRESLFPGLDGLSKSMYYQCWFYERLSEARKT